MARHILTRSRIFGIGLATAALAFAAACGKSNTTAVTPTAEPTSIVSASASSAACILSLGIAYEPDAGNAGSLHGVQYTHFEGNSENTCNGVSPTALPSVVGFSSSVGELAIGSFTGSDGNEDAVAVLQNGSGGYSLVQDVFGGAVGDLVPIGAPYDVSVQPPAVAGATPSSATAAPVIPDVSSVMTIGGGEDGVALVLGPAASPPAIVGVTSLTDAPPAFGSAIPFVGSTYTLTNAAPYPRSIIGIASAAAPAGTAVLVRGQGDLLALRANSQSSGYQFDVTAQDTTLGTGIAMRGNGDIAFDPNDGTRALVGSNSAGSLTTLTLITGLPAVITHTATLTMPGNINSIAIAPDGDSAVVGTTVGIVVVTGIAGSALQIAPVFAASPLSAVADAVAYTNCNGTSSRLDDIYSVAIANFVSGSTVNQFLVALGTTPGLTCPSGYDATLIALPFDPATATLPAPSATPTASPTPTATANPKATASPAPTSTPPPVFVQNNMVPPPAGADLLVVR